MEAKYQNPVFKGLYSNELINEDTLAMGIARVGSQDVCVKAGKISELIDFITFIEFLLKFCSFLV